MNPRIRLLKPDDRQVRHLAENLDCSTRLARLLINRGLENPDAARAFLAPDLTDLPLNAKIKDMKRAVARIAQAITTGERILIFGDYDVDGVTATVLLHRFLEQSGGHVDYYIPHRIDEGYGLAAEQVESVLKPSGCPLVITADCGSGSQDAVAAARLAGIDVIVTDHHEISQPPDAVAVINPMRSDCPSGLRNLAGVGVAFFLILHLRKYLRRHHHYSGVREPNVKQLCDLVALGTVADMVPLTGANRILTRTGLAQIGPDGQPGLAALAAACDLAAQPIDAQDIAFRLAPRINAAGRMGHAATAAELLLSSDRVTADRLAGELVHLNRHRQTTEGRLMAEIDSLLSGNPELVSPHSLVLAGNGWHPGILGIAAAKLVRRYCRPVVLISTDGSSAKGSARSVAGFDMVSGLARCRSHLTGYGGHRMAAGLQLPHRNLDDFRQAFEAVVASEADRHDFIPEITADDHLALSDVTPTLMDELERLGPFGNGNPEPVFITETVRLVSNRPVGGIHQRLRLRSQAMPEGPTMEAMRFSGALQQLDGTRTMEAAIRLRWNHWQGQRRIQMILE